MRFLVAIILATIFSVSFCNGQDSNFDPDAPSLGNVKLAALSVVYPELEEMNKKPPTKNGVYFAFVCERSAAAKAGLREGDILIKFDGQKITSSQELLDALKKTEAGKEVEIVGYSQESRGKGKAPRWKRGTATVTPSTAKESILGCIDKTTDEITGNAQYSHFQSSKSLGKSTIDLYIYETNGKKTLAMRNVYNGSDWIFVDNVILSGVTKKVQVDWPIDRSTENTHNQVWEWHTNSITDDQLEVLKEIVLEGSGSIRYNGKQYKVDRELRNDELWRIAMVISAYNVMNASD